MGVGNEVEFGVNCRRRNYRNDIHLYNERWPSFRTTAFQNRAWQLAHGFSLFLTWAQRRLRRVRRADVGPMSAHGTARPAK
jgi:hypothetical protein